ERGNPDRQRRQDFGRRAVVRQRGQTHADAVDRRPACRGRQPLVQPGEGEGAAGAELFDDACAGEAVAGETLPHQGDGALIAALFDQLSDRMTAHQHDAGFGIVVAEHGLARDDAVESITHGVAPRSFNSRAIAARNSGMPAPLRAEVGSTSGKAAGCLVSAAWIAVTRAASSASGTWSALVSTI